APKALMRVGCAAYAHDDDDFPAGVVVLSMDLNARLNRSPEYLDFLTDETGKLLVSPGPLCLPGVTATTPFAGLIAVSDERRAGAVLAVAGRVPRLRPARRPHRADRPAQPRSLRHPGRGGALRGHPGRGEGRGALHPLAGAAAGRRRRPGRLAVLAPADAAAQ